MKQEEITKDKKNVPVISEELTAGMDARVVRTNE